MHEEYHQLHQKATLRERQLLRELNRLKTTTDTMNTSLETYKRQGQQLRETNDRLMGIMSNSRSLYTLPHVSLDNSSLSQSPHLRVVDSQGSRLSAHQINFPKEAWRSEELEPSQKSGLFSSASAPNLRSNAENSLPAKPQTNSKAQDTEQENSLTDADQSALSMLGHTITSFREQLRGIWDVNSDANQEFNDDVPFIDSEAPNTKLNARIRMVQDTHTLPAREEVIFAPFFFSLFLFFI